MPLLSIIIVNYRSAGITCQCLSSLKPCLQELDSEIILIDNGALSDDRCVYADIIPGLIYIAINENVGFSRANNIGIEKASGAYLLLLNSDTLFPDTHAIAKTLQFLQEEEKNGAGLVGCKLLNADGQYEPSFFPFRHDSVWLFAVLDNPLLYRFANVSRRYREPAVVKDVLDVSGAFMMMSKKVIERVGPFDPDFFLYYEESEWCRNRICRHYRILYYPHAAIVHLGGGSTPAGSTFLQQRLSLSLFWYKKGWGNYLMYIFLIYLTTFLYLPLALLVSRGHFVRKYLKAYWMLLPYIFFYIPRKGAGYGKRSSPLVYGRP